MLEFKGTFECPVCGHKVEGTNIEVCPSCKSEEIYLMVPVNEIQILPKVSEMAERINSDEAYQKAEEVFTNATYHEAACVLYEAIDLLKVYLKRRNETEVGRCGNLGVIATLGEEIGDLASVLDTLIKKGLL